MVSIKNSVQKCNTFTAIICKPSCYVQDNFNQMSYAPYPQWGRFFYQSAFCNTASHIWQVSCQNENRRYFLDLKHPNLCLTLENYDDYFGNGSSCSNWPSIYFQTNTGYFDWEWFECNNWLFIWLPYFAHILFVYLCLFQQKMYKTRKSKGQSVSVF